MDLDSFKLKNIPVPQTQTRQIDNLNIASGSQNPDSINYTENLTIKYIQPEIITKRPIYMYPIAFIQNIFPRRRFISFLIVVLCVFSLVFFILYFKQIFINRHRITYNSKYPLSNIYHDQLNTYSESIFLTVVMVSDEDKASRIQFDSPEKDYWISYLKNATLTLNRSKPLLHPTISVNTGITKLISKLAYQHRGMELSELIVYDGRMLTIDDRSGIVYEIKNYDTVVPRYILSDGPGNMTKGFKGEWATVKDKKLYIGGMGREYIAQGQVENKNNLWIKIIGKENVVISVMWDKMYNYLRKRTGYIYPGYISHEAVVWDDINKQWCFLPRRASNNSYTEEEDLVSGTNLFICTNEANTRYKQIKIGEIEKLLGFSSFRFVPHTENKLIVAIKTHEQPEDSLLKNKSYLWLFDINGNVYADHILIGEGKYEGLEFV